jgi:hypothetical protein
MPPVHTTLQGIGRLESLDTPRTLIGKNITSSHISFSGCHRRAAPEVDDPLFPYFVAGIESACFISILLETR